MAISVKIKNFLIGYSTLSVDEKSSHSLINACIKSGISYEKASISDGRLFLKTSLFSSRRLKNILSRSGTEFEEKSGGLPIFLLKYKSRYGIAAGVLIFFLINFFAPMYVWDIRVSGNSTMTEAEVRDELSAVGFDLGYRIGKEDVDRITNAVLLSSDKIAWMAINMNGSVAYVKIREKIEKASEFETDSHAYSNMVATRNGVIERIEVLRGKSVVDVGQSVSEGDLLISGVIESTHGEVRLENAIGKIYATTSRDFSVNIPLTYEKKILSDSVCTSKTLKFFSDEITFFKKDGKTDENCVKIKEESSLSFFGLPSLPIGIISELESRYKTVSVTRSYEEASEIAFFELGALIESELGEAELLEKTIKTEITDKEFIISCHIICLENIAKDMSIIPKE